MCIGDGFPCIIFVLNEMFDARCLVQEGQEDSIIRGSNRLHILLDPVSEIDVFYTLISSFWRCDVWIDVLCATKNTNKPLKPRNTQK
ncbi:hypothetical protein PWYN_00675 [Paenibacillus wynnii]|uniref:Uncharacterized protein n=1 Tax=Paenibacillus wynnii TaxID=268407 RepID=A0A098MFA2_9BACL|nr:hypothetical protein PWYN_00675 [Paenibacillus wynnii]